MYIYDIMHIQRNFSLLPYNTFHIDCKAAYFVDIQSPSDFVELIKTPERQNTHKKLFIG